MRKIISVILIVAVVFTFCANVCAAGEGTRIDAFFRGDILIGVHVYPANTLSSEEVPEGTDRIKSLYWDMESLTPLADAQATPKDEEEGIVIKIGDREFKATLYDNKTAKAFKEKLPMELTMQELNGNEKYYYLDDSLPTNAERVGTIHRGDIMLYGSSCVVLFYETFDTSYSYTKIGHIDDVTNLSEAVGRGSVTVIFE